MVLTIAKWTGDFFNTVSRSLGIHVKGEGAWRGIECTGDITFGLPIVMVTGNHDHPVSFGKASPDVFCHGPDFLFLE